MGERIITIRADFPAYGGLAIGRLDGKVVMIKGAIPGETVQAVIEREKKDYCLASAVKILEPSPDRVEPECGQDCGGCQLQYVAYGRQVRLKEQVLQETLRRMAKLEVELAVPLTGEPWRYRRRGQFKVSGGKAGLFREKSHEVVEMRSCPLMTREINEALAMARGIIAKTEAWELHLSHGDDGVAALIKAPVGKTDWGKTASGLLEKGFIGVWVEAGRRLLKYHNPSPLCGIYPCPSPPAGEGRVGAGRGAGGEGFQGHITLDLNGISYTVSPASFFQSNWELNRRLAGLVVDGLGPLEGRRVLDIYSGAGNFSLPVSARAAEVVAVEENPFAVNDGKRNAELNGIKNCSFVRAYMDTFTPDGRFDIVIADPPRTGLSEGSRERILAIRPERAVYVSCDPATLARDLKALSAEYAVESVRLVDFFPQTYHIEAAAFLTLK